MIDVRGTAKHSATNLMKRVGIWSAPVEQSDRRFLMTWRTFSLVAGDNWKRIPPEGTSGRLSIRLVRSSIGVAWVSSVLWAVVAKKGTEPSFGTTVITATILFIISILFSRVTVDVLVFVLRVAFFHLRCCASSFCTISKFCVRVFWWQRDDDKRR